MDTFGTVCRNVRVLKGLSQVEVATRAEIYQSRVSEIERDTYSPGLDLARSIARGLDVKLSALIAATEGDMTAEEIVGGTDVGNRREGRAGAAQDDPELVAMARSLRMRKDELARRREKNAEVRHRAQPKAGAKVRAKSRTVK